MILQGIWAGMIFGGTAVQTLILCFITLRCDWEKEVKLIYCIFIFDSLLEFKRKNYNSKLDYKFLKLKFAGAKGKCSC